jgi:hypothetical protein
VLLAHQAGQFSNLALQRVVLRFEPCHLPVNRFAAGNGVAELARMSIPRGAGAELSLTEMTGEFFVRIRRGLNNNTRNS